MSNTNPTLPGVLLVSRDGATLEKLCESIRAFSAEVFTASTPEEGLNLFSQERPRLVLLHLPDPTTCLKLLQDMLETDPGAEIVVAANDPTGDLGLNAIRAGACDYLREPIEVKRFVATLERLLAEAEVRRRFLSLDFQLLEASQFEGIIGRSAAMLDVFARIRRIAPHFRTVLITGPTGTGKELVARALHSRSPVASRPLAICNCSAFVETLLETELFGYVKGAFTGANQDKLGVFEYANGGTVFLDEIGEMPLDAQAKLLRVLQNQEVRRVGSPVTQHVDVRVIAATHRDVRAMVKEGIFREDLFFRLAMLEVRVPDLADRKEDLPLLCRHFLKKNAERYEKEISGLTRRAQTRLAAHSWPGNVRELENVLGNASIMAVGHVIDLADLPEYLRSSDTALSADGHILTLEQMQMQYVARVLEQVSGNKARAAELLGVSRGTIYQLLRKIEETGHSEKKPRRRAAGAPA